MNVESATPTKLNRRDALKVISAAAIFTPLMLAADTLGIDEISEPIVSIQWYPTDNSAIIEGFKEAQYPTERWLQIGIDKNDIYYYGLPLAASISNSQMEPGNIQFIVSTPISDTFILSTDPADAGIMTDSEGRVIPTVLDARIPADAIKRFNTAYNIEFFLYEGVAVPLPFLNGHENQRYLPIQDMPEVAVRQMFTGPPVLGPMEPQSPDNTHLAGVGPRQEFFNAIRVTQMSGLIEYFIGYTSRRTEVT